MTPDPHPPQPSQAGRPTEQPAEDGWTALLKKRPVEGRGEYPPFTHADFGHVCRIMEDRETLRVLLSSAEARADKAEAEARQADAASRHLIQREGELLSAALDAKQEAERLREALEEIAKIAPPDDWTYHTGMYGYCGYGKSGDIDFVDEPDESNGGDLHLHGWRCGEWSAAKIARALLAERKEGV